MRAALLLPTALLGVARAVLLSPAAQPSTPLAAQASTPLARKQAYTLHEEAAAGDANAVGLFLAAGVSSDARNEWQSTPLHMAVLNGHEEVASTLIGYGADVNAANEDGNTPLHAAVGAGQRACAQLLIAHGADVTISSHAGMHPFLIAAQKGDSATLSALLDAGGTRIADPTHRERIALVAATVPRLLLLLLLWWWWWWCRARARDPGAAVMEEDAAHAAFSAAIALCESTPEGGPLSRDVPVLLQHVFDADMQARASRDLT
jgi:hypothetical protein